MKTMGFIKEFKAFAMRGNVMDMAIGIILGAAFGKIVTALVNNVILPPVGMLLGGSRFASLEFVMQESSVDAAGNAVEAIAIRYGLFLQVVIDFLIVAFVVFMVVRTMNRLKRKEREQPAAPPAPSREEVLLAEIRDLLKTQRD